MSELKYNISDINYFFTNSTRRNNDLINKKRENILIDLINNDVSIINDDYINNDEYGEKWKLIKNNINNFLKNKYENLKSIKCVKKAGRLFNYDFDFIITKHDNTVIKEKYEFKYGALSVELQPQFVSLGNIDKYFDIDFTSFHYNNYLFNICKLYNITKPEFDIYKKEVNSSNPKCLEKLQSFYYNGCKNSSKYIRNGLFKEKTNKCKELSKTSIKEYLNTANLKINILHKKLEESQDDKCYILCKDGIFNYQKIDPKNYKINTDKPPIISNNNSLDFTTVNGKIIRILLRWKNGNGVAFPALQIKNIIPKVKTKTVKELKKIAIDNNIKYLSNIKKAELIKLLDTHNIKSS
jgi:hypothetical protein